jgi:hypothetical protein
MCFACWITKATDMHSEYVIPIPFPGNSGCANEPHVMFVCAMPVTLVSVLKDRKPSLFNIFIFICKSSDDWFYVSQACHHSNSKVEEQLQAEIKELKEKLEEREKCLEAIARDLANLWYV